MTLDRTYQQIFIHYAVLFVTLIILINTVTCYLCVKNGRLFFTCPVHFQGWKTERVVEQFDDGRVIVVLPNDHFTHQKKVRPIIVTKYKTFSVLQ